MLCCVQLQESAVMVGEGLCLILSAPVDVAPREAGVWITADYAYCWTAAVVGQRLNGLKKLQLCLIRVCVLTPYPRCVSIRTFQG